MQTPRPAQGRAGRHLPGSQCAYRGPHDIKWSLTGNEIGLNPDGLARRAGRSNRQLHSYLGALFLPADGPDLAAIRRHNGFANRQPQPESAG